MGQVYSNILPGLPYNTSPNWFKVYEFQCFANDGEKLASSDANPKVDLTGQPLISGHFNSTNQKFQVQRADGRPTTFVQEPDNDNLVLQVPYSQSITMKFILSVSVDSTHGFRNLTVAHAASAQSLDAVIKSHTTENRIYIGDFPSQEQFETKRIEIQLVWDSEEESIGGQPIHFAFFEDTNNGDHNGDHNGDKNVCNIISGAALWIAERTDSDSPQSFDSAQNLSAVAPISVLSPSSPQEMAFPPHGYPHGYPHEDPQGDSINARLLTPVPMAQNSQANTSQLSNMSLNTSADTLPAIRPSQENVPQSDDGPQFRTAIASMERMMPGLKARVKQLLKRVLLSRERLEGLIEADEWLAASIQGASKYEIPTLRPIAPWFSRYNEGGLSAIQRQRKIALNEVNTRIVEPLQKFYDYDIKSFDMKKRDFEEYSNQFYSWTSKYLSSRKDIRRMISDPSDSKFANKKRAFDIARYDYFCYLNEVTSGLKQQILLQLFALTAQTLTDSTIALGTSMSERTRPAIDETVEDIKEAARLWETYRLEGIETRKVLTSQMKDGGNQFESVLGSRQLSPDADPNSTANSAMNTPNENYKEGILWASSRPEGVQEFTVPNKQALQNIKWHKYWVVLDGLTLREYSNWKQTVDLHNEPINLLVATAKEAKRGDRRFCFEVVTPQYKRVYQATSEEEVKSWINAINSSISNLLESNDNQNRSLTKHDLRDSGDLRDPKDSKDGKVHSSLSVKSIPQALVSRAANSENLGSLTKKLSRSKQDKPRVPQINTSFSRPPSRTHTPPPFSAQSQTQSQSQAQPQAQGVPQQPQPQTQPQLSSSSVSPLDDFVLKVKQIPSNERCAECDSAKNVEWVSINLLTVLCIDCSGAHRSLGTHISKVRSLKLDIGAFTPSLKAALLQVSNEKINDIWEARLPVGRKVIVDDNIQTKVKFVSEKYMEKKFVKEVEKPNALLRRAINEGSVLLECEALASRANPNSVSDDDEPLLIYALRCGGMNAVEFPIAEVLSKNGAEVSTNLDIEGLGPGAAKYLAEKRNQL